MDLTKFKTVDETIKITMIVAICCCLFMALAFTVAFIFQFKKIDEAYTKALVLDPEEYTRLLLLLLPI